MSALTQIQKRIQAHTPAVQQDAQLTRAAVLIPLIGGKDELELLFTVRTDDVEHHKGQISFPGGSIEASDDSLEATALRETHEELALKTEHIEILGRIDDMWTPTGYIVTPFVGFIQELPVLSPQPSEVSDFFTVPLAYFLDESNGYTREYSRGGESMDVWFYDYGRYTIWGVTAFILRNFKAILENSA